MKSDFYFLNTRDDALSQKNKFLQKIYTYTHKSSKKRDNRKRHPEYWVPQSKIKIKQISAPQGSFRRSFGFALEYMDTPHTKRHH